MKRTLFLILLSCLIFAVSCVSEDEEETFGDSEVSGGDGSGQAANNEENGGHTGLPDIEDDSGNKEEGGETGDPQEESPDSDEAETTDDSGITADDSEITADDAGEVSEDSDPVNGNPDEMENDDSDPLPDTTPDDVPDPVPDADDTDPGSETVPDSDTSQPETHDDDNSCSENSQCSEPTPYCSISTLKCIANAVFISEYVEGSGNNKAIEIYNGSKSSINLSGYVLKQANAGDSGNRKDWGVGSTYTYSFSGSLEPGKTLVLCNYDASISSTKCNVKTSDQVMKFNGNDGMALFKGSVIVDQVGTNEASQTPKWSVAGKSNATTDHTLRRKTSVIQGNTNWNASAGTSESDSEWEVKVEDYFDNLGIR